MTAVEFLVDELNKEMGLMSFVTGTEESYKSAIFSIIERAKEMEKEQIMMAHCHNRCLNNKTYECSIKAFENSEQYYNETFNTEDK